MPSLSTHEDTSSQFAKREKIAAPLVKAIGTFFAVTGPRFPTLLRTLQIYSVVCTMTGIPERTHTGARSGETVVVV
jgi:hypothetical protein